MHGSCASARLRVRPPVLSLLFLFAQLSVLSLLALCGCWSPPEPCSHGKKAEGLWASEGFPVGGKAGVCDDSNERIFRAAQKGQPAAAAKHYEAALQARGWKSVGVGLAGGDFREAWRKDGVVITGGFSESGGTSVEFVKKADCQAAAPTGERWKDLASVFGPETGYACGESSRSLVLLLPGGSLEEACAAFEKRVLPGGYRKNAQMSSTRACAFTKDASNAYSLRAHESLASYPTTWTRVAVDKVWSAK